MTSLDSVRQRFAGPFVALLWLVTLVVAGLALFRSNDWPITLGAILMSLVVTVLWRRDPIGDATRWLSTIALCAQVALLVLEASGTTYQIDMHMAFFAALAVAAAWICPVSILLATVVVAVHHLVLNFVYPAAVFPYGADLGRVVVHAVILLAEAVALMLLTRTVQTALGRADEKAAEAEQALVARRAADAERERLEAEVEATRRDVEERVLATIGGVVSAAQQGDFSHRANGEGLGRLATIVEGVNTLNGLIDRSTREFVAVLTAIADGDLTTSVRGSFAGRLGELADAINGTARRLSQTVGTIQQTAIEVKGTAQRIRTGADHLLERSESQAASLEETSATTEELAASVRSTAQAAQDAVRLAQTTMTVASNGGVIAEDAVAAMARIEEASRKVSEITGVIDEIAFQTNLLALNAAVEAARAGDAGKGFAVVASEVRSLAQRAAGAAKDIAGLIDSSNREVVSGVALVQKAGGALGEILSAARDVSETLGTISVSTQEQAAGLDEMSQTVGELETVTQHNSEVAEQSASAAAELDQEVEKLNRLVPPSGPAAARWRTRRHWRPEASTAAAESGWEGGRLGPPDPFVQADPRTGSTRCGGRAMPRQAFVYHRPKGHSRIPFF
jgi:methyl-accepting chemotaxis protein